MIKCSNKSCNTEAVIYLYNMYKCINCALTWEHYSYDFYFLPNFSKIEYDLAYLQMTGDIEFTGKVTSTDIKELEKARGKKFKSAYELVKELNNND